MLRVPFEWFQFTFECFETVSNGLNLDFDVSNPFQIVRIWIRMFRISFEGLEYAFECLKFGLNGQNLHSNASSPFRMVRIYIQML